MLKFYQKFKKIFKIFEEFEKIIGLVKSFINRIFPQFHFILLYTAERDIYVIVIFKKSGGARAPPGPSDATPMSRAIRT